MNGQALNIELTRCWRVAAGLAALLLLGGCRGAAPQLQLPPGAKVLRLATLDDVPTLVLNAAKAEGSDLIVMGTHGRRGFQRLILGSVAERCVRQSTLPVLLIPSAAGNAADSGDQ